MTVRRVISNRLAMCPLGTPASSRSQAKAIFVSCPISIVSHRGVTYLSVHFRAWTRHKIVKFGIAKYGFIFAWFKVRIVAGPLIWRLAGLLGAVRGAAPPNCGGAAGEGGGPLRK